MKFYLATLVLSAAAFLGSAQSFDTPSDCVLLAKGNQESKKCAAGIHPAYPSGETMAIQPILAGQLHANVDGFLCCKVTTRTDVSNCVANPDGIDGVRGCAAMAGWTVKSQLLFGNDVAQCCANEVLIV